MSKEMIILSIEDLQAFIANHPEVVDNSFELVFQRPVAEIRYIKYGELLGYLEFYSQAEVAVSDLRKILQNKDTLDQWAIRDWMKIYHPFFKNHMFSFGMEFMDSGDSAEGHLHIPYLNEYVDPKGFIFIIQFWESMWFLLGGQYNVKSNIRQLTEMEYYSPSSSMTSEEAYSKLCVIVAS